MQGGLEESHLLQNLHVENKKMYFTDMNNNTYERFFQYFESINFFKEFNLEFVALCNNAVFPGYKHGSKQRCAYS